MSDITRIFSSPTAISAKVDDALVKGLKTQFPIENKNYALVVDNIQVHKKEFSHEDEKEAILKSRSLTYPIRGDLKLINKATGKVVDEEKNFSLMDSFPLTGKHTLVYNGNNYAIANQLLLRPGVYTRRRDTGELEAHFNTGTGRSFSISLKPQTGLFYLNVHASSIPLYPLLTRVFKLGPGEITKYIPKELLEQNKKAFEGKETKVVADLYSKLVDLKLRKKGASPEEMEAQLKASLSASELSPKTTLVTLGKSISSVTDESVLLSLRNLVQVHTGEREEDNRDSLQFKRVQNLPDYLTNRFLKDHQSVTKIKNKLSFNLEKLNPAEPKIRSVIPSKPFSKIFSDYILKSPLSSTPSETNPIESVENVGKVTVLGKEEGGIADERGVPTSARNIDPSHLGIIDPSRTPESGHVGIDQRFTISAHRDHEGNLYTMVVDRKGEKKTIPVDEIMKSTIGFPGQAGKKIVQAQVKGQIQEVDASKVDYWINDPTSLYTITTNLVPFLNSNHPGRLTMAGKAIPQALSLVNREVPLVQTLNNIGTPFTKSLGGLVSTKSPVSGKVMSVTSKYVTIKDKAGKSHKISLVKNLPFNMKGFLDDEKVLFHEGDEIKEGDILAENNYTKDGHLALGKNLTVAYLPYKGYNHEDGIVISKTAADSMSSHHSYKVDYSVMEDSVMRKALLRRYFPNKFTPEQLGALDEKGFAIVGSIIKHGDPVYAVLERREPTAEDKLLGRLHKTLVNPYSLITETWLHDEPGLVVDAHTEGRDVRILLRSVKPLEIGDKLTGLHGNKGIVSLILEDKDMPKVKATGKPVDLLLNPASVTSRINLGQIMETVAAKIANATGKPYKVHNFGNENNIKKIKEEMAQHGVSDTDELIDPTTNKSYGKVLTGPQYILKLYKTTDQNYSARNVGKYDNSLQPIKGGEEGSKSIGYMELLGLLGSDARKNLKEIGTVKSEENTDFWDKFRLGQPIPKPRQTFATQKFFNYLTGAGIKVNHATKNKLILGPLTDHDVLGMSNGEIKEPLMLSARKLDPETGGLFDTAITGGMRGKNWSHYKLVEPIVNPVMENAVKSVLNLSTKEFDDLASGALGVRKERKGVFNLFNTVTGDLHKQIITGSKLNKKAEIEKEAKEAELKVGGPAFEEMLKDMNVDTEIEQIKDDIKTSKSVSRKNTLIKNLKYFHGLKKMGLKPEDAYLLRHMPVVPPLSRPVTIQGGNSLQYADVNQLYRDHMLINNSLKGIAESLPPDQLINERKDFYNGAKAVVGVGEAISGASRGIGLKGLIKQIAGEGGPKTGFFHDKILKKKQDFSGRGTIYAEPNLGINELAVPKEALWTMYKFHVIRDLVKKGYSYVNAEKAWVERNDAATTSFTTMIKNIPVIMNRAPTLMKSNISAYFPVPIEGRTIGVNPLHLGLIAGDYDGDAVQLYLPMTPEAVSEAKEKLLPKHQIYDYRRGFGSTLMAPAHEAIIGSVHMTEPNENKKTKIYKTEKDALAALKSGEIEADHPIIISG